MKQPEIWNQSQDHVYIQLSQIPEGDVESR